MQLDGWFLYLFIETATAYSESEVSKKRSSTVLRLKLESVSFDCETKRTSASRRVPRPPAGGWDFSRREVCGNHGLRHLPELVRDVSRP